MNKLIDKISETKEKKIGLLYQQKYEEAIEMRELEKKYQNQLLTTNRRINTITKLLNEKYKKYTT